MVSSDQTSKVSGDTAGALIVTEGIAGVWSYHLSLADKFTVSLCGRQTMKTGLPLSAWGIKSKHIPESYCRVCAERGGMAPTVKPTSATEDESR